MLVNRYVKNHQGTGTSAVVKLLFVFVCSKEADRVHALNPDGSQLKLMHVIVPRYICNFY